MIQPRRIPSPSPFARALLPVVALFMATVVDARSASPALRCELLQGGDQQTVDVAAVSDPYTVKSVEVNGRFRFKPVFIGSEHAIDYIALNVYYRARRQWVLLHQAKYLPPFNEAAFSPGTLTGVNRVYSPVLGRELQYSCTLSGPAP
jgi:hypothetical protein